MKTRRLFTLPTRDTSIGHWRFGGNLDDLSSQANTLTGQNISSAAYVEGYTEQGITAVKADSMDSPARKAFIPAASAGDFDFGTQSFTIELIFRTAAAATATSLIQKWSVSPETGFMITTLGDIGTDHVRCDIGDGTNYAFLEATIGISYGAWNYVAIVVDRTNGVLRIAVNGESAGAINISAITGSLSNAAQDLLIQSSNNQTWIDEICISAEALTLAAIAERAAGFATEISSGPDDFLLRFLPTVNHTNTDLQQFLIPPTRQYLDLRQAGLDSADLIAWDRVPARFLAHLASLFGFELIDAPFATEAERREMLKWIAWIYRRKGTKAAAQKLIELLGFTVTFNEVFPDSVPFLENYHRLWSRDQVKSFELADPFSTIGNWNYPLTYDSRWEIVSGKLRGVGNGSDSQLNGITIANSLSVYRLEAKYAVVSGLSSPDKLGLYLKWVDSDNYIALVLNLTTGSDWLSIDRRVSGTLTSTTLFDLDAALASSAYRTGEHRLWIFADHTTNEFTGGIDDRTLFFDVSVSMTNPASTKKGLFVNKGLTVDFDDFNLQDLNDSQSARLWTDAFLSRKVQITLAGTPAFVANKTNYLKYVLNDYVPAGTELEFL